MLASDIKNTSCTMREATEYDIAVQKLKVAARRFAMLYLGSETDEGRSWGEEGQPLAHAEAVVDAIETVEAVFGTDLGIVVAATKETP